MSAAMEAPDCIVIGTGLAGSSCAAALAERGAQVLVLGMGGGASQLPVGLLATHLSSQDSAASQLSRVGVSLTLQHCDQHLHAGQDFQRVRLVQRLVGAAQKNERLRQAALNFPDWYAVQDGDVLHLHAAWIKPQSLVRAWLSHSAIRVANAQISSLHHDGAWRVVDRQGSRIAQAKHIVLAAGTGTAALARSAGYTLELGQVDGAVCIGPWVEAGPSQAFNGHGHFIGGVVHDEPGHMGCANKRFWLSGSTYERETLHKQAPRQRAQASLGAIRQRTQQLLPQPTSDHIDALFAHQQVRLWRGSRCTSSSRLPLAQHIAPGLYVCSAMGSRGLSFAAVCGQIIANLTQDAAGTRCKNF